MSEDEARLHGYTKEELIILYLANEKAAIEIMAQNSSALDLIKTQDLILAKQREELKNIISYHNRQN